MAKVIRPGTKPGEQLYTLTCPTCNALIQFKQAESILVKASIWDLYTHACRRFICPECHGNIDVRAEFGGDHIRSQFNLVMSGIDKALNAGMGHGTTEPDKPLQPKNPDNK
jgi:hypothetical protein